METKIKALISLAIIVILFLIIIRFKIKSDKKRKSLAIPSNETIKPKGKQPYLVRIPSAVLAILTLFGVTILAYGIGVGLGPEGFGILRDSINEVSAFIIYFLVIAPCCFFIVKQNPRSMWYVPIICNLISIIQAIVLPGFWTTTSWWGIIACSGWVLSITASIIGARIGKRNAVSDNH